MKSFLIKIIALVCFLNLIQIAFNAVLPPSWGNEVIYRKMRQMNYVGEEINTLFIGSSRVHCHIDPNQFDAETDDATVSWNIGAPGAAGLEVHRIVDQLITNHKSHNVKTIYVELPRYNPPPIENEGNVRANYFYYIPQWLSSVRFIMNRNKSQCNRGRAILESLRPLTANLIGTNTFRHQVLHFFDTNLNTNLKQLRN